MKVSAETIAVRHRDAQAAWLDAELVVLDPQGKRLRGFNGTGARVWELMEPGRPAKAIAEQIASEFKAPAEQVLADVLRFLDALVEKSLVQVTQTPSGGGR